MTNDADDPKRDETQHNDTNADRPSDAPDDATAESAEQPTPDQPGEEDSQSSTTDVGADEPDKASPDESNDDDLPEWEELTPELVEDEAIRGDFMLRWAVILLAFLLGCREIHETVTLVHIKTGQYLAAHGWWPPATDVFSHTATDHAWRNFSWLLDLLLAGIYAIGPSALSVFVALLAAGTFYMMSRITKPEVPTWWSSLCAAMALLVCYSQFNAGPTLVTLFGLALTLLIVHRWEETGAASRLWYLVPVFLIWSNLDARVFLGAIALILYAVGESLSGMLGRGSTSRGNVKTFWGVVLACLAVMMLNPFGWRIFAVPCTLYFTEYPALRLHYPVISAFRPPAEYLQFQSMMNPLYWRWATPDALIGTLLLVVALTCLALNRARLSFGHLFVFLGLTAFALAAGRQLAPAVLVASILAGLNAQDWYRHTFRQTYSVNTMELLYSRGGRAITVLAFFAIAFLAISGRLMGRDGKRVGLGFSQMLQTNIDGMREILSDSLDNRPFNFQLGQGDLLIWVNQQPFIDNRVGVYAGSEDQDLIRLHNEIRHALRSKTQNDPLSGKPDVWKAGLNRFHVTHAVPRLYGQSPDDATHFGLLSSTDWVLTRLGGAGSVFYRADIDDSAAKQYVATHRLDLQKATFRSDAAIIPARAGTPRPPTFYDKYLTLPQTVVSNASRAAGHCLRHLWLNPQEAAAISWDDRIALAYRAIQNANQALSQNANDALAYRVLGSVYAFLADFEARKLGASVPIVSLPRYYQAVTAFHQSLVIEPNRPSVQQALFQVYDNARRDDLALQALNRYIEITASQPAMDQRQLEFKRRCIQRQRELTESVQKIRDTVSEALKQKADRFQVAQDASTAGFVLEALKVLEADRVLLEQDPKALTLQALLLLESGRAEEAAQLLVRFEGYSDPTGQVRWREPAAWAGLALGDRHQSLRLWSELIKQQEHARVGGVLATLPLTRSPAMPLGQLRDFWPIPQTLALTDTLYKLPGETTALNWYIAVAHLDVGRNKEAAATMLDILKTDAETPLRPLVGFYLEQLTGEKIDAVAPVDDTPLELDPLVPSTSGS